jgi:hypothetical protein
MLTKCANPGCSEQFLYLHQGKLFHLSPIPELQKFSEESCTGLYERYWLCDQCCKTFTVIWDGFRARVVPLLPAVKDPAPSQREDCSAKGPAAPKAAAPGGETQIDLA